MGEWKIVQPPFLAALAMAPIDPHANISGLAPGAIYLSALQADNQIRAKQGIGIKYKCNSRREQPLPSSSPATLPAKIIFIRVQIFVT